MGQGLEGSTAFGGQDCKVARVGESERRLVKSKNQISPPFGAIAQLGERIVRNDEVVGSIPTSSTNLLNAFVIGSPAGSAARVGITAHQEVTHSAGRAAPIRVTCVRQ